MHLRIPLSRIRLAEHLFFTADANRKRTGEAGAVEALVKLLGRPEADVLEQVADALRLCVLGDNGALLDFGFWVPVAAS